MPTANLNGITLSYALHLPPTVSADSWIEPTPVSFPGRQATQPDAATSKPHSRPSQSKAPLIVALAGLSQDKNIWTFFQIPTFLGAGFRVLTMDNRGIGESSSPSEITPSNYSTEIFADDVWALVNHLGLVEDGFHLMGMSMGGMICQEYVAKYASKALLPDGTLSNVAAGHVKSLTLAVTYATGDSFTQRTFGLWRDLADEVRLSWAMKDIATRAFSRDYVDSHPVETSMLSKGMENSQQPKAGFLGQILALLNHGAGLDSGEEAEQKLSKKLEKIDVPTMVISGDEDAIVPFPLGKKLYEALPNAEWKLAKGGHATMFEFPEYFNQAVIEFINKHSPRSLPSKRNSLWKRASISLFWGFNGGSQVA